MKLAYPVASAESDGKSMAWYGAYDEIFPQLREMGYEGIELLVQNPEKTDIKRLETALGKWGLKIAAIGTSPMQGVEHLFLIHPDQAIRQEARRRCGGLLRLCARYQVPALIGKYRGQLTDEAGCKQADLELVLKDICREAGELGVQVLLEPQNSTNINNINTIGEGLEWIRRIGYGRLGLLADIYHMGITEKSICESLKMAGRQIGFIHMSDSGRKIPGEGELPLKEVMEALKEIPYEGYISLEIGQKPDSFQAAAGAVRFLKKCLP